MQLRNTNGRLRRRALEAGATLSLALAFAFAVTLPAAAAPPNDGGPGTTPKKIDRADVDGSGVVDWRDILEVLAHWGDAGPRPADVDEDGIVGLNDLLGVLAALARAD